jgi:hypothetical protein
VEYEVDRKNAAELAAAHELGDALHAFGEAIREVDGEQTVRRTRRVHHRARLVGGSPERLLAKHRNAALERANFAGAVLARANLAGADLQQANLARAHLDFANLNGANLGLADLRNAVLTQARLAETDLSYADLRGANLRAALVRDASFGGARYDASTQWPDGMKVPPCPKSRSRCAVSG